MLSREMTITGILWLGFVMFGCTYMKDKAYEVISEPDNVIEELIEEVIEMETGLNIDLTPFSPE